MRIYPLRLTKRRWQIPLRCHHSCSERCSKTFVKSGPTSYTLRNNPDYKDGKCSNHDKIESSCVKLDNFDPTDPTGSDGPLHNPNEVVIPDRTIFIDIDYPLVNKVEINIDFGHKGVTRAELLYTIYVLYKHIYTEEERTAPPQVYQVFRTCTECANDDAEDHIIKITFNQNNKVINDCSICFQNYEKGDGVKLPCNHIFHNECILPWLKDKNTCPLCRHPVVNCDNCEGKGGTYHEFETAVIPVEDRGILLNRNRTYGIFGIYGHDLEDLWIENLHYDRDQKRLWLGMGS